jgi:LCP family protein required for cell wall assembly
MAELPSGPRRRSPSGHPGARQSFLVVAAVLALVLASGSAFSIATIKHVESGVIKLNTGSGCTGPNCLHDVTPQCLSDICNFLILGSDTRTGLSKSEQGAFGSDKKTPGQRSDTIILVRVDAAHDRTIVLSIPRDLRVNIPGHGLGKINTAFDYGPNVTVKTVRQLTGLPINHYVEINFDGFQGLVNALGGVPICVNQPMHDVLAGLDLPHAGCYKMRGAQALAFVRARHIQGDVIPDFSRIARQQQFIRAVIQKVESAGEVFRLPALIKAVQHNLVIDKDLNLYALQDLTRKLSQLGQTGVDFRVVPATPVTIGGVDYVELVQPDASQLFERIRKNQWLGRLGRESLGTPISPANIIVRVADANSGGKAQALASFLQRAGFVVLPVEPAPPGLSKSEILARPGTANAWSVVASYTSFNLPIIRTRAHTAGSDVTIVVGRDFPGIPS